MLQPHLVCLSLSKPTNTLRSSPSQRCQREAHRSASAASCTPYWTSRSTWYCSARPLPRSGRDNAPPSPGGQGCQDTCRAGGPLAHGVESALVARITHGVIATSARLGPDMGANFHPLSGPRDPNALSSVLSHIVDRVEELPRRAFQVTAPDAVAVHLILPWSQIRAGRRIRKDAPPSGRFTTVTSPPWACTSAAATASPMPDPPVRTWCPR